MKKSFLLILLLVPLSFHAMDLSSLSDALETLQKQLDNLQQMLQPTAAPAPSPAPMPAPPPQPAQEGRIVLRGEIPVILKGIGEDHKLMALLKKSYPRVAFKVYEDNYTGNKQDVGIIIVWHSTRLGSNMNANMVNEFFDRPIVISLEPSASPQDQNPNILQMSVKEVLGKENVPTFALSANIIGRKLFDSTYNTRELGRLARAFRS